MGKKQENKHGVKRGKVGLAFKVPEQLMSREQSRRTLVKEYHNKNKKNAISDRRFGEKNGKLNRE